MRSAPSAPPAEGVIKFNLEFTRKPPPAWNSIAELEAWREILFRLGLTGRDPTRYGGLAYGNVSLRTGPRSFIVSGTQTGGKPRLGAGDYCLVSDFEVAENRIRAEGPVEPSSEALTHGAVYEAAPRAACVVHAHSPEIWRLAEALGVHRTDEAAAYGTPEMGRAVSQAAMHSPAGLVVMGGHGDGVLAFADSPKRAAVLLLRCLAKALELDSPRDGHSA